MSGKRKRRESFVGLISDTHGLLRPEAVEALAGATLILHAGDIGDPRVLEALKSVAASVVAVRGNNDRGGWALALPEREAVRVGLVRIYMLHDLKELELDPAAEGFRVVVSGHSHKPSVREHGGVLYVNPGAAGPRRFKLPVTVARLTVSGKKVSAEIIELKVDGRRAGGSS